MELWKESIARTSVRFEKFVGMDNAVEPCTDLTNKDIVREVCDSSNGGSEPEEDMASQSDALMVSSNVELARTLTSGGFVHMQRRYKLVWMPVQSLSSLKNRPATVFVCTKNAPFAFRNFSIHTLLLLI